MTTILPRITIIHNTAEKISFAPIILATRSKCVSEDFKEMEKTFAEKNILKIFFSKSEEKKIDKKGYNNKNICVWGRRLQPGLRTQASSVFGWFILVV